MSLYMVGRIQKPRLKSTKCTTNAKAVIDAVAKVLSDELSPAACERWRARLNAELGVDAFQAAVDGSDSDSAQRLSVPRVWVPSKPKITWAACAEQCRRYKMEIVTNVMY